MSKTVSVTLQGAAITAALSPLAYSFAWLVIRDTCLKVRCPALTEAQRLKMRDCRAALESVMPDLPPVEEPSWPMDYRRADMVTTKKGRVVNIAGLMQYRVGHEEKPRRGAKRYPYFSDSHVSKAAQVWRDAFLAALTKPAEEQNQV